MTLTTTTFQAARLSREIAAIIKSVALDCGTTVDALKSKARHEPLATHRQLGMLLLREKTRASFPDIARAFNRGHHGTAIHACAVVPDKARQDPALALRLDRLRILADEITSTPTTTK